jgi:hypothetical protein
VGQRVALNGQLSVVRVDEDIHWYVRAAAFGHGVALVSAAQGGVQVERELFAGDVRSRWGGDGGLSGRVARAAARYHDCAGEQGDQNKECLRWRLLAI